ncbi:MAG: putative flap endonuclease-1-like 5' DNA nuclease [Saprospiraceae bacterium]
MKSDILQIIKGIGPKMVRVLKENGVNSHSDLAAQTPNSLQAILDKYGDKYKIIDPTTWAQQAEYAAIGDYPGMIDLQKKLDTGKDNAVGLTASKLEKYLLRTGALKAFKQDDLKAIEGIGSATEKLLHENGIKTWRDMANNEASAVKTILTAAGSRFALGDPTTWPKQAELAADGKFDELREYQDFLDGGRA